MAYGCVLYFRIFEGFFTLLLHMPVVCLAIFYDFTQYFLQIPE